MRKASAGFTLLELVVVMAIFTVFAAMAYGGLNYVLSTRRALEERLDRSAEWQKAFQRLRNDLQQATPRPSRDGFGETRPALLFEDFGQRLEFTRAGWRNPLYLPRPSLERVVYRYDEDERQLLRETWRNLDRATEQDPVQLVVLAGIDELSWRFLDSNREWRDRWPVQGLSVSAGNSPPPPKAVELNLRSRDFGEVRWLFRPGAEPIPQGATQGGAGSGGSGANDAASGSGEGSGSGASSGAESSSGNGGGSSGGSAGGR